MKFTALASAIGIGIISLVVLVQLFAGLYPTVITTLTAVNNSGKVFNASGHWTNTGYDVIPLRSIIAPDGVVPLILVAILVIAVVIGLFAMVKTKKR